MVEMKIQVPEPLAERLKQERARLPEVLALGCKNFRHCHRKCTAMLRRNDN